MTCPIKIYSKLNTILGLVVFFYLILILPGCTKDFEDYNKNPNLLTDAQSLSLAATAIGPLETNIFNSYQTAQNLSADAYCGYMMSPTNFLGGNSNLNYYMADVYNAAGFGNQYNFIMAPVKKLADAGARTSLPDIWGVALLLQVHAMDRVTDRFGPIPYTKAGTSLSNIPYDDQQTIYDTFFKQIDTAVTNLKAYIANPIRGVKPIGAADLIYGGDYNKWLKFANTLRLRLAMRIAKIDPVKAKQQGELALADAGGLLTDNADNAFMAQSAGRNNDFWLITYLYNFDNMMNATIGSYLSGYNDPRAPIMFIPAKNAAVAGKYVGIRIGIDVTAADYRDLSPYNYTTVFAQFSPQQVMVASETWFLKAEAALRDWTGAGDAKLNYETGIQTSMSQWGVNIGNYLNDAVSTQANYTDPHVAGNSATAVSNVTIKWDDTNSKERKLERIITQKWLALFPDGQEAWADYRRTGYPKLFTAVQNLSNGTISSLLGPRRLPYPLSEATANPDGLKGGIDLLKGEDNGGTRLWWDVDKANF